MKRTNLACLMLVGVRAAREPKRTHLIDRAAKEVLPAANGTYWLVLILNGCRNGVFCPMEFGAIFSHTMHIHGHVSSE